MMNKFIKLSKQRVRIDLGFLRITLWLLNNIELIVIIPHIFFMCISCNSLNIYIRDTYQFFIYKKHIRISKI